MPHMHLIIKNKLPEKTMLEDSFASVEERHVLQSLLEALAPDAGDHTDTRQAPAADLPSGSHAAAPVQGLSSCHGSQRSMCEPRPSLCMLWTDLRGL